MKKGLSLLLTTLMLIGAIAGLASAESGVSYPLETDEVLTYWIVLNTQNVAPNYTGLNDTEFSKYLQEETGVRIEFVSPAADSSGAQQAFSLLVASGNMPDIIEYDWVKSGVGYPGGAEAAIANNVIMPLNDLIDTCAPDLKAILDANPNYDKMVKTDAGNYYIFPVMKLDDYLNTTAGMVVRYDWLEELGLPYPETMDDWYNTLKAFKEQKGAEYPLSFPGWNTANTFFGYGILTGAYGIAKTWYVQDGKPTYGAYEPGYKDWLLEMNKWYSEGLLDNNFATNDQAAVDSNILNNASGATALWLGSGLGKYLPQLRGENPDATLGPVTYPVLNAGDTPQFSSLLNPYDGSGAVITTSCKNPELAAKFLNYGYTEAGRKTYNYGREGISYYYDENGDVYLTEAVTKNEDGWPLGQAWSKYAHGVYPGPYFSERRFLELYYPYEEQVKGLEYFTATDMASHLLPPISPTPEEASEFARIMTDVKAYEDEYTLTAIMGTVDIESTYEAYIEELKNMGIEDAIAIQTAAYERYNAR